MPKSKPSQSFVEKVLIGHIKRLGHPHAEHPMDRPWETAMFKRETDQPIWLSKGGLEGDEVADNTHHGGPEKALFAYPSAHYSSWQRELQLEGIGVGGMGENLAVTHMDESTVCIGDIFKWGEALIQVSQPRRPCWKPARRFRILDFALRIQESGRTGWYFRVLKEGYVASRLPLELVDRPYPQWTVAFCNQVMYGGAESRPLARQLAACPALAEYWRRSLERKAEGQTASVDKRVYGPNKGID